MRAEECDWFSASDAAAYVSAIAGRRLSARTLLIFARNGKIDFTAGTYNGWPRNGGRKLWFHKSSLDQLVETHKFPEPRFGLTRISKTLSSRKIAASRYAPGEVITKDEAASILGISVRGAEYLMDMGRLKAIRLGPRSRPVVFKYKKILALQCTRTPRSGKRIPRCDGKPINSKTISRLIRAKIAA